eukprot:gnl/MRDRNA2_/MRDRNA2_109781_c0_seq1.p1 gnl/MRDRNA2_/MRDRNA2_109781_c0~~gnl/MRDRNA2_/MRDRNA2_109781_c0_seq1.p1  ORF type:complete len:308 (+),score=51.50 gnl/MRDRNA2_/MRDRNA2_109781_c0_seq1:32-955(+)
MDCLLEPILDAWAPPQECKENHGLNNSPFDWNALASTARFQYFTMRRHPGWQSVRRSFRERCRSCIDSAAAVRACDLDVLRHCVEVRGECMRNSSAPLLHIAIRQEPANVTIVKYLLGNGFDHSSCKGEKVTPLYEALIWVFWYSSKRSWEGLPEAEVVRLLLKAGANAQSPAFVDYGVIVNKGDSPLAWLLEQHGKLEWRLGLDSRQGSQGSKVSQVACSAGLIQLLVDHGACAGPGFQMDRRRAMRLHEILGPRTPDEVLQILRSPVTLKAEQAAHRTLDDAKEKSAKRLCMQEGSEKPSKVSRQ